MSSQCRSCGAAITWAFTPNGNRMPVDAEPSDDGNVKLTWSTNDGGGRDAHALVLTAEGAKHAKEHGERMHSSHFRTCPNAKQHRKARG